MAHELRRDVEIELGVASLETQGVPAGDIEETLGLPGAGLSDD